MYSLAGYGEMIADTTRLDAYAQALRRVIGPESVVVDLGAGTGILSLLACQCGARKVYAVDAAEVLTLAEDAARANGFADRVVLVRERSTKVVLPEPADVIVSDLRGVLPPFRRHFPDLMDARQRLLAPGGRLIPERDSLWAALVEAPELHRKYFQPWLGQPHGLDLRSALPRVTNHWFKARVVAEQLLSHQQQWAELPYRTLASPHVQGEFRCPVNRDGSALGVIAWFDSVLTAGVGFSNAPGAPPGLYGQAFFPWPEPVPVRAGDVVDVRLRAQLVHDDYVWCWDAAVRAREAPDLVRRQFRQSTFLGTPLSPQRLRKAASQFLPRLNEDGQVVRFLLHHMQGQTTVADLARALAAQFPERFADRSEASTFIGEFCWRYSC